jgi:ubiquinone/menaquinone biosynthesis C-methylase UbiE
MIDNLTASVAKQYNHFQSTLEKLQKPQKYLNFGYALAKNEPYEKKQEQLCKEVFQRANIQPEDTIVDVGFGSGEQDFLLASLYSFGKLYGFNIAEKQVEYANHRAVLNNLNDRMVFHHAPAENMAILTDGSVNKVIAVECAFHFDRPRFYQEAARILQKEGMLVLADICFMDRFWFLTKLGKRYQTAGTVSKNRQNWEKYFQTVECVNINKQTWRGAQQAASHIISNLFKVKTTFGELGTWILMAVTSQIVALGLLTHFLSYDFIVLKKK